MILQLKRGTLVKGRQTYRGTLPNHLQEGLHGIILEQVFDPMNGSHNAYKVLWNNGEIGTNIWIGDLEVVEKCNAEPL